MKPEKLTELIAFDEPRIALQGANDLEDTVEGGLHMNDRIQVTVIGDVLERRQAVRGESGAVKWVKVVRVDTSFDLQVLNRVTDPLPFGKSAAHASDESQKVETESP